MCSCHGSRWCIQNLDVVGFDLRWAKRKVEQRQIIQWDLGLESTSTMESLIVPCVQKKSAVGSSRMQIYRIHFGCTAQG